ncbi:MAG TPA: YciI family protein [Candidatus Limnocylindrales bacterium]
MAKYLVLIYGNEQIWTDQPPAWQKANAARHAALIASAGPAVLGVDELEPTARAVSIRRGPKGKASVTDGPFQETKEIVGGYYLLEAPDLDEAIRLASQIPEATDSHGGVEIRPIVGNA